MVLEARSIDEKSKMLAGEQDISRSRSIVKMSLGSLRSDELPLDSFSISNTLSQEVQPAEDFKKSLVNQVISDFANNRLDGELKHKDGGIVENPKQRRNSN